MWGGVFVQEMDGRPESVGKHRGGGEAARKQTPEDLSY